MGSQWPYSYLALLALVIFFSTTNGCETDRLFFGSIGSQHPDLTAANGIYLKQDNDERGFPVFKHELEEFYIYHIRGNLLGTAPPSGYWAIGLTPGSPEAIISARSEDPHPAEVGLHWRVWNIRGRSWKKIKRLKAVCVGEDFGLCPTGLLRLTGLASAHSAQARRLGLYEITNRTHELRPVYKHVDEHQFLFFHNGLWLIGPVIGKVAGGLFVPDNAWRPELIIQDWVVFNGWILDDDPQLKFTCQDLSVSLEEPDDGRPEESEESLTSGEVQIAYIAHLEETGSAPCTKETCHNGGVCSPSIGRLCLCPLGYFGAVCQNEIDCGPLPVARSMDVIESSGSSFLDIAFIVCFNRDGSLGPVSSVVCQADGTWTRRKECPSQPEALLESQDGEEEGPVTFDLDGGRSRFRFRVDDIKERLDGDS